MTKYEEEQIRRCYFSKRSLIKINNEILKHKSLILLNKLEILKEKMFLLKLKKDLKYYDFLDLVIKNTKEEIEEIKKDNIEKKELIKDLKKSRRKFKIKSIIKNQ